MKTYTFTWRHAPYYGKTMSRVRFDSKSAIWDRHLPNDEILQFMSLVASLSFSITPFCNPCCRLIKCGKLIARQATYQGV